MNKEKLKCRYCGEYLATYDSDSKLYTLNIPKVDRERERMINVELPARFNCRKHPSQYVVIESENEITPKGRCSSCGDKLCNQALNEDIKNRIKIYPDRAGFIECGNAIIECPACKQLLDLEKYRTKGEDMGIVYPT